MPSSNFDLLSIVSSNSDGVDNAPDFLENVIFALRDDDVRENLGEGSLALDAGMFFLNLDVYIANDCFPHFNSYHSELVRTLCCCKKATIGINLCDS